MEARNLRPILSLLQCAIQRGRIVMLKKKDYVHKW